MEKLSKFWKVTVGLLLIILLFNLPIYAKINVMVSIAKQEASPMIDFAASEIEKSLVELGYSVETSFISKEGEYESGDVIILGVPEKVEILNDIMNKVGFDLKGVEKEGFKVKVNSKRKGGRLIMVVGIDERGVMYGGLELSEQIKFMKSVDRLKDISKNPYLKVRGYHYNLPLQSVGMESYTDPVQRESPEWFYDIEGYWRPFLDKLAKDRYNALVMWDPHPFDRMVRLRKYPEATYLSMRGYEERFHFWSRFFKMAKERGIDTYLLTWNIHISKAFAEAHNLEMSAQDHPLIRDYMRECISTLLKTYPDLTGIGTAAGERMRMEADEREEWIKDTYVKGVRQSGRIVPFIHRYWAAMPKPTQDIIAFDYPGEVLVTVKFNGEHLYAIPTTHFYLEEWITQKARDYQVLWHLWNSSMYIMRWGDPDFVEESIRNCRGDYSDGYVYGTEFKIPGEDRIHTDATKGHKDWDYEWERRWFTIALWGRLGYDPYIPEDLWIEYFNDRFVEEAGEHVYLATKYSSKILPKVTTFHWNYMDYDWWVEGCIGPSGSRQPRVGNQFHNVHEFIYNYTIEDQWLNIPEYVDAVLNKRPIKDEFITPLEVADELDGYADMELEYANKADKEVNRSKNEWECTLMDLKALAYLGHYYAEKIRGATDLMFVYETNDKKYQESAVKHLENALSWWKKLVDVNDNHWKPHLIISHSRSEEFSWGKYLPDVEEDVRIARELRPVPKELMIVPRYIHRDSKRIQEIKKARGIE